MTLEGRRHTRRHEDDVGPEVERLPFPERLHDLERDCVRSGIPGFFPTPRTAVETMLVLAEIKPNMRVLEPSAGRGDIAETRIG